MKLSNNLDSVIKYLLLAGPKGLSTLGRLQNCVLAQKLPRIYVDDPANIRGVALISGAKYKTIDLCCEDTSFAGDVMKKMKAGSFIYFPGIEIQAAKVLKEKINCEWENPCDCYYYPHKTVPFSNGDYTAVSIDLKDAAEVDSFYTYRSKHSLGQIREEISSRPSAAIYVDGEIASWAVTHFDNSMGAMFTKPKFRKQGMSVAVTQHLMRELLKQNITPYVQIVQTNLASKSLAEKCGMLYFGRHDHFGGSVK